MQEKRNLILDVAKTIYDNILNIESLNEEQRTTFLEICSFLFGSRIDDPPSLFRQILRAICENVFDIDRSFPNWDAEVIFDDFYPLTLYSVDAIREWLSYPDAFECMDQILQSRCEIPNSTEFLFDSFRLYCIKLGKKFYKIPEMDAFKRFKTMCSKSDD